MFRRYLVTCAVPGLLLLAGGAGPLAADEGMWLFNAPPRAILKSKYQFEPTDAWLMHLQQSSVRFNSGGSGSFVSSDGLVMSNHHVGADDLQKLSTDKRDLLKTGFHAKTLTEELKCLDLELNVLQSIEDVTKRVRDAVSQDVPSASAQQARRAILNTIEKESLDKTGLRSDVVTLYQGGQYHLYRYKKYTDVRLVFAPEQSIAFFGGDVDNFEFPRYDLDVCFFRVYEGGKPARIDHYLTWSAHGAAENELVFVAGHPGQTDRLNTVAHLKFLRDRNYPSSLRTIFRREVLLKTFGERGLESARRAQDEYFGIQNGRKARLGGLAGLQDPRILQAKEDEEKAFRKAVVAKSSTASYDSAWKEVEQALAKWTAIYDDYRMLELEGAFNSELFDIARTLVRLASESGKPNGERLREFRESNLESLKQRLFSPAPLYEDLEIAKLSDSLSMLEETYGGAHPLVDKILAGRSPRGRAAELVRGTRLKDVKVREQVAAEGAKGQAGSDDPMMVLARLVDGPSRDVRKSYEQNVDEPLRQAYGKIAQARFELQGDAVYPDATFTLRLAFGTVTGYEEDGKKIPAWTTMGGTFERARENGDLPPFHLPESWQRAKDKLALQTPFNFVSTVDIIGGNSGSPVVNRRGEVVGLIFDGNIQSLVLDFVYTSAQARAVSVHSSAIIEALRAIYGAETLAEELQRGKRP